MTTVISQSDYKKFKHRVGILAKKGVNLDYQVVKPNHKRVKIVFNKSYDWDNLDKMCEVQS
mgnify:FL=1